MNLTVNDLSYTYRGGHTALQNVSFTARQGELLSVLGPNGAGKSTLFRCILGGLPDYGGTILLDGRDARTLDQRALAAHIAYIPQIHRPTFGYSVLDTALMGLTRQLSPFRSPSAAQEEQAMAPWSGWAWRSWRGAAFRSCPAASSSWCLLPAPCVSRRIFW